MGRDGEGDKKEVKGWKRRGKDLPDQCQIASYAPASGVNQGWDITIKIPNGLLLASNHSKNPPQTSFNLVSYSVNKGIVSLQFSF